MARQRKSWLGNRHEHGSTHLIVRSRKYKVITWTSEAVVLVQHQYTCTSHYSPVVGNGNNYPFEIAIDSKQYAWTEFSWLCHRSASR